MATKEIDESNLSRFIQMCENYAPGYSGFVDMTSYPVAESRYEFVINILGYIGGIDETGQDEVSDFLSFMTEGFGTMPFLHVYFMSNSLVAGGLYSFIEAEKNINSSNEASVMSLLQNSRFDVNSNSVHIPEFEKGYGLFSKSVTEAYPFHVRPNIKMNYSYNDPSTLSYFPSLVDAASEYETLRKTYVNAADATALTDDAIKAVWSDLSAPYSMALSKQSEHEGAVQYLEALSVDGVKDSYPSAVLSNSETVIASYMEYISEFLKDNVNLNDRIAIRTEFADLCIKAFNEYINDSELSDDEAEGSLGVYDGSGRITSETFGISRMLDSFSVGSSAEVTDENVSVLSYSLMLKYGLGYSYQELESSISAISSYIKQTAALHELVKGLANAIAADSRFTKGLICL